MPSPQEIIIENPYADEYDTQYGDWPDVGDDMRASSSEDGAMAVVEGGTRPYIRLDGRLRNVTRVSGDDIRLKCEVVGSPLPIHFSWFKNDAPLERDTRYKVKNREYASRLRITDLRVLDTAYYTCKASNGVGDGVETTGVLNVKAGSINRGTRPQRPRPKSPVNRMLPDGPSSSQNMLPADVNPNWMIDPGTGRLVMGTCQVYMGEACRGVLTGRRVLIEYDSAETIRDIDRDIHGASMTIARLPSISDACKQHSRVVACFHRYHICSDGGEGEGEATGMRICQRDCETIVTEKCPTEFALADATNLVGDPLDNPSAIFPQCSSLPTTEEEVCVPVLKFETLLKPDMDSNELLDTDPMHTCYVGSGCAYRGETHMAENGQPCQPWSQHASKDMLANTPYLRNSHAFCRNPDGRPKPWCYTRARGGRVSETYCRVPKCPKDMYNNIRAKEVVCEETSLIHNRGTTTTKSVNSLKSISSMWNDMDKASQYAVLGGAAGLSVMLLLLLICCVCCCRKRTKSTNSNRARGEKHIYNQQMGLQNGKYMHNEANMGYIGGVDTPLPHTKLLIDGQCNGNPLHPSSRLTPSIAAYSTGSASQHTQQQQMEMQAMLLAQQQHHPAYAHPQQMPVTPHTTSVQIPEIGMDSLTLREALGAGAYGVVYKAEMSVVTQSPNGSQITSTLQVAVKTLKDGHDARERADFEDEILLCAQLRHPNIVQLLGMGNSDGKPYAVLEYMIHGNLNQFLHLRNPYSNGTSKCSETSGGNHSANVSVDRDRMALDHNDFLQIANQIACGMEYLSAHHYVHRDLATRNVLVTDRLTIKIADMGLCRDTYACDYYTTQTQTKLPVRWMPVEAIVYGKFSEFSDVWSYGVTLWEIYSYGKQPYFGYSNEQVVELVRQRCLLEAPANCPTRMYSLMVECWHECAQRRVRFTELAIRLQNWVHNESSASIPQMRSPSRGSGHPSAHQSNRSMSRQSNSTHTSSGNNNHHGKMAPKSQYHVKSPGYADHAPMSFPNGGLNHNRGVPPMRQYEEEEEDTDSSL